MNEQLNDLMKRVEGLYADCKSCCEVEAYFKWYHESCIFFSCIFAPDDFDFAKFKEIDNRNENGFLDGNKSFKGNFDHLTTFYEILMHRIKYPNLHLTTKLPFKPNVQSLSMKPMKDNK